MNTQGSVTYDRAYAPFGETYAETGTADRFFTGNTQDVIKGQTGIYDFLFREHSAGMGRWLSPDPAGLAAVDITNPQTWNRYAYVGNNPLSNIDPLGLACKAVGGQAPRGAYPRGAGGCSNPGSGGGASTSIDGGIAFDTSFSGSSIDWLNVQAGGSGAVFLDGGCLGCQSAFFAVGGLQNANYTINIDVHDNPFGQGKFNLTNPYSAAPNNAPPPQPKKPPCSPPLA